MSPLLWTCKSTRNLADALTVLGHDLSHQTVGRLLTDLGYSLQSNRKTEGGRTILTATPSSSISTAESAGRLGGYQEEGNRRDYKNPGREREPKGRPRWVKSKDFPDKQLGKVAPCVIYDLTANKGWVNVGIDQDTAEFAVESIRRWWYRMGHAVYPGAKELLITADSGGAMAAAIGCGKSACKAWRMRRAWRSRCVTSRPGPVNGTRSSIGCSATSPRTGAGDRW
jgi:hypothetical protein